MLVLRAGELEQEFTLAEFDPPLLSAVLGLKVV